MKTADKIIKENTTDNPEGPNVMGDPKTIEELVNSGLDLAFDIEEYAMSLAPTDKSGYDSAMNVAFKYHKLAQELQAAL